MRMMLNRQYKLLSRKVIIWWPSQLDHLGVLFMFLFIFSFEIDCS